MTLVHEMIHAFLRIYSGRCGICTTHSDLPQCCGETVHGESWVSILRDALRTVLEYTALALLFDAEILNGSIQRGIDLEASSLNDGIRKAFGLVAIVLLYNRRYCQQQLWTVLPASRRCLAGVWHQCKTSSLAFHTVRLSCSLDDMLAILVL